MTVVVASTNPAKVGAVQAVFAVVLPDLDVVGLSLASGVPEQPIGFAQTRQGAVNRARAALREPGASWGVGLEGGVRFAGQAGGWLFGIVAVGQPGGVIHSARSAELRLPAGVTKRIRAGDELGPVMDELLGTVDIKKGVGTVGGL